MGMETRVQGEEKRGPLTAPRRELLPLEQKRVAHVGTEAQTAAHRGEVQVCTGS